jgi:predicted RNase H-like HicB family nuclease/DNA-binding XRE family transcriptional regulator
MHYDALVTRAGRRQLVEFPDCPGCQTFAEPGEDVSAVAQEALEGWLELHLEDGDAPPRPSARVKVPRGARIMQIGLSGTLMVRLAIRWARQDAGLSQGALAKRMGVARQQVSLLESSGSNLTIATIEKIASALGVRWTIQLGGPARSST